jgi:GDP-L-fucose synthase
MKILVTGGNGMMGRTIKELVNCDVCGNVANVANVANVFVFATRAMCDLEDRDATLLYFQENKFDHIIHLAACVGGLYKNMSNNVEMFMKNIKINTNVVEAAHASGIKRGIFCLSSCIFPKKPSSGFPMQEEIINDGEPHDSNQGYAYAKRMLFIMCAQYNQQYGRKYTCLSPVNLYGPHDHFNTGGSHVIPEIIKRLYDTYTNIYDDNTPPAIRRNMFEIYGTGSGMRQFLYAKDFAHVILEFAVNENNTELPQLINVCGNNCEYTISEVVKKIFDIMEANIASDRSISLWYNDEYSDGILQKTVSNSLLSTVLPADKIDNFTDIDQGLLETIQWFLAKNE